MYLILLCKKLFFSSMSIFLITLLPEVDFSTNFNILFFIWKEILGGKIVITSKKEDNQFYLNSFLFIVVDNQNDGQRRARGPADEGSFQRTMDSISFQ